MPIYEYRCLDCHHEFELMQKFSDPPADNCPSCTGIVQKLISRSAFHLKGDGWYVTDYARKSGSNGSSDSKSTSDANGSSTDSTSESKTSSESKASSESSASTSKESSKSSTATASSTVS